MNLHIIYTPFTGVGLHGGFRGNEWYKNRIDLFKNYTLKSLLNQTNRNFIHWMSFRPEEEYNQLTEELEKYLKSIDYRFIFTFNGLMYHDDKFTRYSLKSKTRNVLMMLRDSFFNWEWHPVQYYKKYAWDNKNDTLLERLKESLDTLNSETKTLYGDIEWIYLTRIDSDDMFHEDTVSEIQSRTPEINKALVFTQGYIYNRSTEQLADWNPPTNPPFHTIIFSGDIFFDPQKHLEYYKDFRSHEDIPRIFNVEHLDDGYCVLYHDTYHISTSWNSPLDKKIHNKLKYGKFEPHKGYLYLTHGKNISTRWKSRATQVKNEMIGEEYCDIKEIGDVLRRFGIMS